MEQFRIYVLEEFGCTPACFNKLFEEWKLAIEKVIKNFNNTASSTASADVNESSQSISSANESAINFAKSFENTCYEKTRFLQGLAWVDDVNYFKRPLLCIVYVLFHDKMVFNREIRQYLEK